MNRKSIRFKMTIWFALMLIIVAGITEAFLLIATKNTNRKLSEEALRKAVNADASLISYRLQPTDTKKNEWHFAQGGYLHVSPDYQIFADGIYHSVFFEEGVRVYGEDPLWEEHTSGGFSEERLYSVTKAGTRYMVYEKPLYTFPLNGKRVWMVGVLSQQKEDAQLERILCISLAVLPVLILLAAAAAYLIVGKFLKPLGEIEKAADAISEGEDLNRHLEVGSEGDEVGSLAASFNRMTDRLRHSFETERQFTSDASHELRTPTSVILAQSEYMLEKLRWPHEYREGFETVKKQGERMNALISDMLDYTRMEQGSEKYPFEEVDLSALVRETAQEMGLLKTRGIELQTDVQEGLTVQGNRELLVKMLENLISNGYRYGMDNGFIRVMLQKEAAEGQTDAPEGGERIVLSVSDNGIGIPEEDLPKIFDRFYRVDSSRSAPGTGLGLPIVKRIADMHHAEVQVESEEGGGSIFRVVF